MPTVNERSDLKIMKQRFCIFALMAILAGSFFSCDDTKTYAEQLDEENASIKAFMKRHGFRVVKEIPTTVPWPDSVYYKTESGMYIHVQDTGTYVVDTIPDNTVISVRYLEYDMSDTLTSANMYGSSDPAELLYNNVSSSAKVEDCVAWHEALDYVGDNGHVFAIIPAEIGWSYYSDAMSAHFYELRYSFWK